MLETVQNLVIISDKNVSWCNGIWEKKNCGQHSNSSRTVDRPFITNMTNYIWKKKKKSDTLKHVEVRKEAAACPALTPLTVTMSRSTVVDGSSLPFFLPSSVTHFLAPLKNPISERLTVRPGCAVELVFYSGVEEKFFHFPFLFLVLIW